MSTIVQSPKKKSRNTANSLDIYNLGKTNNNNSHHYNSSDLRNFPKATDFYPRNISPFIQSSYSTSIIEKATAKGNDSQGTQTNKANPPRRPIKIVQHSLVQNKSATQIRVQSATRPMVKPKKNKHKSGTAS